MSVNKPWYEIGDLIHAKPHGHINTNEAALVVGIDFIYETYRLLPLQTGPYVIPLTNEKMSFHVAHTYFQKV